MRPNLVRFKRELISCRGDASTCFGFNFNIIISLFGTFCNEVYAFLICRQSLFDNKTILK